MSAELTREPEVGDICEFCGLEIEEVDQKCAALDDGRCRA